MIKKTMRPSWSMYLYFATKKKSINKYDKNRPNLIRQGALLCIQCFWNILLYCIDTTLNWTRKYKSAGMACIHYCSRPNRGKSFYTAHSQSNSTSFNFLFSKTANKWVSRTETERERSLLWPILVLPAWTAVLFSTCDIGWHCHNDGEGSKVAVRQETVLIWRLLLS